MDITKHNEKVWDEYLNNDYGNYEMDIVNQTEIL